MAERWETVAEIDAAVQRFTDQLPGWRLPEAYGVVFVPPDKVGTREVTFPVVNVGLHRLPALVLGLLTGRADETATYELTQPLLARAVDLLAPAEAATMYLHPNLAAWRAMLAQWAEQPDARVFAVFVATLDAPASSPYDEAFRAQVAAGERAELHA